MAESNCIKSAWNILKDGSGKKLSVEKCSVELSSDKYLTWVHLDASHENTRQWLTEEATFLDDIIIDALLAKETRPRILEFSKGILVILRGLPSNPNEAMEDLVSLRIWVDPVRIISLERRVSTFSEDFDHILLKSKGPKTAGDFIGLLNTLWVKPLDSFVRTLEDEVDDIEEGLIDEADGSHQTDIVTIRKKAIILRRHLIPQREVIQSFCRLSIAWINTRNKRLLHEQYNRTQRLVESLDHIRERSQIINDEFNSRFSAKMSRNVYVLSLITAIFLPLSFLTSLFGINVGGIPGATHQFGFWVFCAALVILVLSMLLFFKRKQWFKF